MVLAAETLRVQTTNPLTEVYDRPSFSGQVIEKLKKQTVLEVSPRKIVGPDGIGAFYEYKNSAGRSVYIGDSEVNPAPAPPVVAAPIKIVPPMSEPEANTIETARRSKARVRPELASESVGSMPSQLGFNFGVVNYAEKYLETRYQASRPSVGLGFQSFFGNSKIFGFDANLLFSPGAPKFLTEAGAQGVSGGYLLIADYQAVARFTLVKNLQVKLGAGLAMINSKFNTTLVTEAYTSGSTRAGAVAGVGISYMLSDWALMLDVRQFIEKESYLGSQVSVLFPL